jgi:hypothetical protein
MHWAIIPTDCPFTFWSRTIKNSLHTPKELMTPDFKVFQIYFEPNQLANLDPAFIPYDNGPCPTPDEREFYVFKKEYAANNIPENSYAGYVSWKFGGKTGITGSRFLEFCTENPGYDVYYINPFPLDICDGNVWAHGEKHHPGITALAQKIIEAAGYKDRLDEVPQSLLRTAYCNYWVGNNKFWDQYMQYCLSLYDALHSKISEEDRKKIFSRADWVTPASYFPYIFERLFSTFLQFHPEIKCCPYIYSDAELGRKYDNRPATLVKQIQKAELENPQVMEPIKLDRELYFASRRVSLLTDLYVIYQRLVRLVPILNWPPVRSMMRKMRPLFWTLSMVRPSSDSTGK